MKKLIMSLLLSGLALLSSFGQETQLENCLPKNVHYFIYGKNLGFYKTHKGLQLSIGVEGSKDQIAKFLHEVQTNPILSDKTIKGHVLYRDRAIKLAPGSYFVYFVAYFNVY